jgi:alanine racemase
MPEPRITRPTIVEIDLDNLAFNYHSARSFIGPEIKHMAVVKANAYGHGATECARRLEAEGVEWFAVATLEEGLELRSVGIVRPILCLGSFIYGQEELFLDNDITPIVYQLDHAESFNEAAHCRNSTADVHVKIDTGMGRVGVRFDEVANFVVCLKRFENLRIDGLMTHFAIAEDLARADFTNLQIDRFYEAVEVFRSNGFDPTFIDLANSPGAVIHPRSRGNMVRLGGILYGLGDDILPGDAVQPPRTPVLSLRSKIVHLKKLPVGEGIGYGLIFVTERETRIAVIPIGYYDGYRRGLSNRANVIINGAFAPVVGRISMDWILVDVTDISNAAIDDDVVLIGHQNGLSVTAENLAAILDTISYEITCGVGQRVQRRYVSRS